jgi:small subunit ribosomal protein S16
MLAIRLKRVGRSGHAQFMVIVQDSRFSPKSGRVVAYLGSYDPHTKAAKINKEAAQKYLSNGAQPSERAAKIFTKEEIKLPEWVKFSQPKERKIRHPEKLRKNRPAEVKEEKPQSETPAEAELKTTSEATETPAQTPDDQPVNEETSKEPSEEKPEAEPKTEDAQAQESEKTPEADPKAQASDEPAEPDKSAK